MNITRKIRREASQLFRLCVVNGVLNEERARKVLAAVASAKPRGFLEILWQFRRLVKLDQARHSANIQSALTLGPEVQTRLQAGLSNLYGPGLVTSFAANPALVGGMRIQVGSDVYDGSVKARLAALEQSFSNGHGNGNGL